MVANHIVTLVSSDSEADKKSVYGDRCGKLQRYHCVTIISQKAQMPSHTCVHIRCWRNNEYDDVIRLR